jgi:hypothetical protein
LKWRRTTGCYGNLGIALLDELLVYLNTRDMHTYFIRN